MKWIKLLWSVVFLGGVALYLAYLSSLASPGKISPAFVFSLFISIAICIVGPIILLLRLLRILRSPTSFIYILSGTASLALGIFGLYFLAPADNLQKNIGTFIILALNIIIGCFIYTDAFVRTIPGLRNDNKKTK